MSNDTNTKKAPAALPESTRKALDDMKAAIATPGTKLGHLANRVASAVADLNAAIAAYGNPLVKPIAGRDITIPVHVTATVVVEVSVGGNKPSLHTFVVGHGLKDDERPETPLDDFPESANPDKVTKWVGDGGGPSQRWTGDGVDATMPMEAAKRRATADIAI